MRQTRPVRRGASLFRSLLERGVDVLVTFVDGHVRVDRPAHLKGRDAKDWDAYVAWVDWQMASFTATVRQEAAEALAEANANATTAPDSTAF